jgi:hypothetical protein
MAEHVFTELGYFNVRTCKSIRELFHGESNLKFNIDWSNDAGNCTLIVRSGYDEHPDGSKVTNDEVRDLFTFMAFDRLAASRNRAVCMPSKLNDLAKRLIELGSEWEHMACIGNDRAPFVMAQMEQVRTELDNEKEYLRRCGYKVVYDSEDKMFYAINGDIFCPIR